MTTPNTMAMITIMFIILITNLMTTKTSIMCMNLVMYTMMMSSIMSMKIKLTPMPFIVFLTMIGGLMIIFLYLAATMWKKKEALTLKTKIGLLTMMAVPFITPKSISDMNLHNEINLFKMNLNKTTSILIIMLTMILIFTIEIHMKANSPFRRKLKIWE